jgi:hypothetical protein
MQGRKVEIYQAGSVIALCFPHHVQQRSARQKIVGISSTSIFSCEGPLFVAVQAIGFSRSNPDLTLMSFVPG